MTILHEYNLMETKHEENHDNVLFSMCYYFQPKQRISFRTFCVKDLYCVFMQLVNVKKKSTVFNMYSNAQSLLHAKLILD